MRSYAFTNQFKKNLKLMEKRHKDMDAIYGIIALLIWGDPLPERYREHGLSGDYDGLTDCHVEGDLVLIYELNTDEEKIVFHYIGTHSDLF
jgi:mRNA interferase YafQ